MTWDEIYLPNNNVPKPRNGMTLCNNGNKLLMFGGIHDITWELDDLWEYNLDTLKWWSIEDDSRKNENPNKIQPPKP